ncbi:MAG: S-layer homology domain-containing protein [Candidatus Gracilibacteria bacterium]
MKSSHLFKLFLFCVLVLPVFASTVSADTVQSGFFKKNALVTDYFQIEYSDLVASQTDSDSDGIPDIVETVRDASEHAKEVILDDLNYDDPMAGYDRQLVIILDDNYEYLGGALGVTSVLSNGDPYIALDPWMTEDYLKITIGHEFFHAVQFGYDINFAYTYQGINWAEATATWMEDNIYNDVNDYVNYLPDYFTYTDYSIFASISPTGTLFEYGLSVWPKFLSEYYDTDTIQDIWDSYFGSSVDYESDLRIYDAVTEVIDENGDDLDSVFQDFALWNLDLSNYEEGSSYPEIFVIDAEETNTEYALIDESYAPALFGTNYLYFENTGEGDDFYFHLVKPEGVAFAVSLVPYDGSVEISDAVSTIIDMDSTMADPISIKNIGDVDGIYAVVSPLEKDFNSSLNSGAFDEGYLYYYLADYADASSDVDEAVTDSSSGLEEETASDKEGEAIGTEEVRAPNTLNLSVVTYDEDSVSFKWNRLNDSDVTGYELRYGTESDEYTKEKNVDESYITSATVTGLSKGKTYYFELVALDSKGKAVLSPSQEISVTPVEWLFTDVSYMHDNYDAIAGLSDAGILNGYLNGSFKPEQEINRAELLKVLIEARGITPDGSKYKDCFKDVGEDWYAKYVCYAKDEGWVSGYSDGTFRPEQAVNKVEALKILFQVYEAGLKDGQTVAKLLYPDLDPNSWYAIYVWKASNLGILEETPGNSFYPSSYRTRGDISEEVYRYLVSLGEI